MIYKPNSNIISFQFADAYILQRLIPDYKGRHRYQNNHYTRRNLLERSRSGSN